MTTGPSTPLVSVLMVNYNHEDVIGHSIESVLNQTYGNFEFIIVDDGSTDASCQIIESYEDPRIVVHRLPENGHISAATNVGFSLVKGEFLARIDSDDVWLPEKLEKQMAYMQETGCDVVFSTIGLIDENGADISAENPDYLAIFDVDMQKKEEWLELLFFECNHLSHPSVLMRTEVMRTVGNFDLAYAQSHDLDYWVRIAHRYDMHVLHEPLVNMRRYMEESGGVTNNSNDSHASHSRFRNEYSLIREHYFDNMPDDLFIAAFGSHFKNPDAHTAVQLAIEKAFLLVGPKKNDDFVCWAGVDALKQLLDNPESCEVLAQEYHFTALDYYELTSHFLLSDPDLEGRYDDLLEAFTTASALLEDERAECNRLRKAEADAQELIAGLSKHFEACLERIAQLEGELEQIHSSTSWKLTQPLRSLKKDK